MLVRYYYYHNFTHEQTEVANEVKQPLQVTQLNPDHLHPGSLLCGLPDMALQGLSGGSGFSHAAPVPKLSTGFVGHGCYHSAPPKAAMADTH